jgi:multidrug transporter EmrE-like cation transporter
MFEGIIPLVGIILLISFCEGLGQSCLKKVFSNPDKMHLFVAALVFYGIVCYLLLLSYKYKGMGIVNVIWSGISILLIVSIGVLFFQEIITSMDKIGIALIIAGIVFVLWEGNHDGFNNIFKDTQEIK